MFHNKISVNVQFNKSRTLSLSFANNQLTEDKNNDFIIGSGYTVPGLKLILNGKKELKSDLKLKIDFTLRNRNVIIRKIVEDVNQATSGMKTLIISITADYMINQRFNIRLFFDTTANWPLVSTSFPNGTTNAGISIRFSLAK